MKSLLIKDTTVDERMQIDYIFGRRELADINREFSQQHAGAVKAEDREKQSGCAMH